MNLKNLRERKGKDGKPGGWAVVYYVPKELQKALGDRREIVRGLGTRDRQEAMRRKHSALLAIQAEVHSLANGGEEWSTENLTGEALKLARARRGLPVSQGFADYRPGADDAIDAYVDAVAAKRGSRHAKRFNDIAYGRAVPISVAAQEWRGQWKGITQRTREKYERTLQLFQKHFQDAQINSITRRDAIEYVEHLRAAKSERTGKPLSDKSIKAEVVTLASFFKACILNGFLPLTHENPFEKVLARMPGQKREKNGEDRTRAVTREEAEKLLIACDNTQRERPLKYSYEMRAMIRLLWVTGARANEIASLTRDRIQDEGDLIWLKVEDAKTDAGNRWLCLVGEPERELVREALRKADEALADTDKHGRPVVPEENRELLFPRLQRGGADRQPYWMIQKAFGAVRKDTFGENPGWNMHSFRRRAVTALAEAGVPEQDRNLVIGHSNAKDFGIHVYADAERRKTVERTMRKLYEELGGSL